MRETDVYSFRCWSCSAEVELAAGPIDRAGFADCPRCDVRLHSEWRASRDEGNAYQPGHAAELERAAIEASMRRAAA